MKITFLIPGRGFSGGIRSSVSLASELLDRGHDVRILYRRETASVRSALRLVYIKFVVRAPTDWITKFKGEYTSFKNLASELVGNRDVVMAIGPDCVEDMMRLPDKCGHKVFYAHGLTLRNPHLREAAWSKEIPKIAVSNYVRDEMLKAGINNVVAVVPDGVDTSEYFPDGRESNRIAIGTVYGSGVAKDPKCILSVFARLNQLRPDIRLVCFGSCTRPKKLIQAVQYKRLPSVTEARNLYSRCAVWFCASRSEGFGLPVLEAMACGCAVVSTDCGGGRDFLKSGINGIIVEVATPDKIVEEIIKIMDDNSKRKQLVDEAFKTVEPLSWSSAACQMEKVLKNIVSGNMVTT